MKEWTRKRKADIVMGIILQVYFLVPVDPSSYDVWIFVSGTENERLCQNI